MNTPFSEQELALQCSNGNRFAQKIVYETFCDDLMILCLRYVSNAEDAREALMDCFLNAFKGLSGFQYLGEGSLKAWLKKIAVNQCLMRLRKKSPVVSTPVDESPEIPLEPSQLEALSAKELLQLIHALPEGYRTVFNLYCFEGHTHRDIAQLLGISENTSKSQLSKARQHLQKQLQR